MVQYDIRMERESNVLLDKTYSLSYDSGFGITLLSYWRQENPNPDSGKLGFLSPLSKLKMMYIKKIKK